MSESENRQIKLFSLLSNPFWILQIEPTATLKEIEEAREDALADERFSEEVINSARDAIVSPKLRLKAELSYLVDTPSDSARGILNALSKGGSAEKLIPLAADLGPISRSNLLAHYAASEPATADLLSELINCHATIDVGAFATTLNAFRRKAGLALPSIENVRDDSRNLLLIHSKAAFASYNSASESTAIFGECTRRILASHNSASVFILEEFMQAYIQAITAELSTIEDGLRLAASALQKSPKDKTLVAPLTIAIQSWGRLAFPLIEIESFKGRDSNQARTVLSVVRSLAIDLFNEHQNSEAARAITSAALDAFKSMPRAKVQLEDDLLTLNRNIRSKQMMEASESGRVAEALEIANELLKTSTDPEEKNLLSNFKKTLEVRGTARIEKKPRSIRGWVIAATIGGLFIYGQASEKRPSTTYPTPPKSRVDYPPPSIPPSLPPPSQEPTYPARNNPPPPPPIYSEDKPSIGESGAYSQGNVRYCRYQSERISSIKGAINPYSEGEISFFNSLVNDFNSRCGRYRYYQNDFDIVSRELISKRMVLASEALQQLHAWRRDNAPPPPRPTFPPQPSTTYQSPPQTQPLPQVTIPPTSSPNQSASIPEVAPAGQTLPADFDLLVLDDAIKAQTRLTELGYFQGQADGVWGPLSRNALRVFKITNRLGNDDMLDAPTAKALFSLSAVKQSPLANFAIQTSQTSSVSTYPATRGTSLNPLNRDAAIRIHAKLQALGYYHGNDNTLWSRASRDALKQFKTENGLTGTDEWDGATEQRLFSATPASENTGFALAVAGIWAPDVSTCPGNNGNAETATLSITAQRAETSTGRCDFSSINGFGNNWKVVATCTVNGSTWPANISYVRNGNELTWSSEHGTAKYQRCPNERVAR